MWKQLATMDLSRQALRSTRKFAELKQQQAEIPVVWCATAFASIVLPQPGGPNISTPRGGSMPICL